MKPKLSICIPLMSTDSHRRRNFHVVYNHLSDLKKQIDGIEIIVSEAESNLAGKLSNCIRVPVEGGFTRTKARNAAWRFASADMICFCDSDMIIPDESWKIAIEESAKFDCFSPYKKFYRLGPQKTENRIANGRFDFSNPVNNRHGNLKPKVANLAGGIFFCTRQFLESVNGWDERFTGWGSEDTAMEKLANSMQFRIGWDDTHSAIHLYHRSEKRGRTQTKSIYRKHYANKSFAQATTSDANISDNAGHPPINDIVAVTALSELPRHLQRQSVCLDTWKDFGLQIISVVNEETIGRLKNLYPQVDHWRTSRELTQSFGSNHTMRINALADVAIDVQKPILLLNSDIELHGPQRLLLDSIEPGRLTVGIRHNYDRTREAFQRERWGMDAFVIEPDFAKSLPRLDLGVGKPVWDYWLPIHAQRYGIESNYILDPLFFHKTHEIFWTKSDSAIGVKVIQDHYGPIDVRRFRHKLPS